MLQGVYGTFIFGEAGCRGLSVDGSTYGIDNVKGGTTLSIYLNTAYSVTYEIEEGGNPPTDTNTYITDKALDENTAEPDFSGVSENSPQADRTEGKTGGWTTSGLQTALTLQNIPDGYTGGMMRATCSTPAALPLIYPQRIFPYWIQMMTMS